MKKRLIVLHDLTTSKRDEAFLNFLKKERMGWWRWFEGSWLLVTSNEAHTAESIRDTLVTIYPNVNLLVLELKPDGTDTWAGFGPSPPQSIFTWLRDYWKRT